MEAASRTWRPLGELLVEKGLISSEQLEQALAEHAATGLKLGEILVERNFISSPDLTETLMEQLGCEVAKENGFGTGLWGEIRRRHGRPGAEPSPAEDRPTLEEDLAGKLTLVPDAPGPEVPSAVEEAEFQEIRASLTQSSHDAPHTAEAGPPPRPVRGSHLEIHVLEQQVAERDRRLAALESELDSLKRGDGSTDAVDALRAELEAAQAEILHRCARVDQLERELDDGHAKQVGEELDAARARVAELEAVISETSWKLSDLETILAAEREETNDLRKRLEGAEFREASARGAISNLERGLEALQKERDAASSGLADRERELAALRDRLAEAETEQANSTARSEEAYEELRRSRDEYQERARKLAQELASEQALEAELRDQLAAAAAAEADLMDRLATAEARADDLDDRASDLSEQLAGLSAEQRPSGSGHDPSRAQAYVCFTQDPAGYRLVPYFGPLPIEGAKHDLDGVPYAVLRIGRSPLPQDSRPCAFLIAAPAAAEVLSPA